MEIYNKKEIIIISINSKEIIDFVNESNGIEIKIDNKIYYMIENVDNIYYIWNDFTENDIENDEYLYHFREYCENKKNMINFYCINQIK